MSTLAQRLADEAVREFGTGFHHGDLTITHATYERIFVWALALGRWEGPPLNATTAEGLREIIRLGGGSGV